jgi:Tfp pilus assembly protein PilX
MHNQRRRHTSGISLIEALAALAVLAFGLLGIAKLHNELLFSVGLSKARGEAVQLAESKLEEMRNLVLRSQHEATTGLGPFDQEGINTQFRWSTNVNAATDPMQIIALVTWTDSRGGPQEVRLISELGWTSRVLSARLSSEDASSTAMRSPTGTATRGGAIFDYGPDDIIERPAGLKEDGTRIIFNDTTGEYQLIIAGQAAGEEALLTMTTTNPDEGEQGFSIIHGRVYFDDVWAYGSQPAQVDPARVLVIPSDGALCTRIFLNNVVDPGDAFLSTVSVSDDSVVSGGTAELFALDTPYKHFYYQCYTGEAWRGSVGIVRIDSAQANQQFCVGDPDVAATGALYSREAALDITRRYEGYDEEFSVIGMGESLDFSDDYTARIINNQHFLSSKLSNNYSCPQALIKGSGDVFEGNAGRFYCLVADGECPDGHQGEVPGVTIVSGEIGNLTDVPEDGYWLVIETEDPDGWEQLCTSTTVGTSQVYSCFIETPGFTGFGTWTGVLDPWRDGGTGSVCTVSGVDAEFASVESGKIEFSGVPIGIDSVILDFEACTN